MQRAYYSSGYVDVADVTCKAVLRCARALANALRADVAQIPVVTEGGSSAVGPPPTRSFRPVVFDTDRELRACTFAASSSWGSSAAP